MEKAPVVIKEGVDKAEAEEMKKQIEEGKLYRSVFGLMCWYSWWYCCSGVKFSFELYQCFLIEERLFECDFHFNKKTLFASFLQIAGIFRNATCK